MPPLSTILRWLDAHGAYLLVLAPALVAAWKAMPAATRARLEAVSPRLTGLVRFVAAVAPDVIGAARIARYQVAAGQPRASVVPPAAVPAPIEPRKGFATVDVLVAAGCAAMLAFSAAVLAGCPLPQPDGCTPGDTRCSREGIPQRCSSTQRWWQEPTAQACSTFGAVCCPARSPYGNTVHACVPQRVCLPEQPSAGATSTPPALAVTQ